MAFLNKPASRTGALKLIRGYDENDSPVYAYVFGEESYLEQAGEVSQRILIDISERATVLHKGKGHKVPEGIEAEVMRKFEEMFRKAA